MDIHSLHNVLIILHAASATIAFFAGGLLIFSPTYRLNPRLFSLYWWTLVSMVVLLAGAIVAYWTEYSSIERSIFPALLGLGIYMLYSARNADHLHRAAQNNWEHGYIESIGFTIISLFEGFIIVGGLNSGIPGWLVAVAAVLGVIAGRWVIRLAKQRAG